jgi:hypothetical protein
MNPLNTAAASENGVRLSRSKPPGWVALGVSGRVDTWAHWFTDSLPQGVDQETASYELSGMAEPPILFSWRPNPDVTERASAYIIGVFNESSSSSSYSREQAAFTDNLFNREQMEHLRKYFSFRVEFDLAAVKALYEYLQAPGWSLSRIMNIMKENASPYVEFDVHRPPGSFPNPTAFRATVNLPRQRVQSPGAWTDNSDASKYLPNEEESQILTDQMNALLQDFYDLVKAELAAAERSKAGEVRDARYSVVLTYKGIVLEVVPVETQQEAIDAMTAMQGDLRIKTVKGGSSKGAKANPYRTRRFR